MLVWTAVFLYQAIEYDWDLFLVLYGIAISHKNILFHYSKVS